MSRPRISRIVFWVLFLLLGALVLSLVFFRVFVSTVVVPKYSTIPDLEQELPRSHLSFWLGHRWVEEQPYIAYENLASQLKSVGTDHVYVHVGPLEGDGTLPPERYAYAKDFVEAMDALYPEMLVYAWIGQVRDIWGGPMRLHSQTRDAIADSSEALLALGFDGIHVNVEPIPTGDEQVLALLRLLRVVVDREGALLSIAADDVEPLPATAALLESCCREVSLWTIEYFQEVLALVDDIAIMTYDSTLKESYLYAWYVSMVMERVASVADGKSIAVGIPTYEQGRNFDPTAENLYSGLTGYLQASDQTRSMVGLAIYSLWEMDEEEWELLYSTWSYDTEG